LFSLGTSFREVALGWVRLGLVGGARLIELHKEAVLFPNTLATFARWDTKLDDVLRCSKGNEKRCAAGAMSPV
jgi:hypothetical protein